MAGYAGISGSISSEWVAVFAPEYLLGHSGSICVGIADLDGDNDRDIVFGQNDGTGGNSIYFNETQLTSAKEFFNGHKQGIYNQIICPNPVKDHVTLLYHATKAGMIS